MNLTGEFRTVKTCHGDKVTSRDLGFLKGGVLIQLILDLYEVRFVFDNSTEIRSAHRFTFETAEPREISGFDLEVKPRPNFYFYQLMFEKIAHVDAEMDDMLALIFESGNKLSVLSEGGPYESLQIWRRDPLKNKVYCLVF